MSQFSKASFNCYPNNDLSLTKHIKGAWEVANSETSYSTLNYKFTGESLNLKIKKFQKKKDIQPMQIEHGLYPSFFDIIVFLYENVEN